MERLEGNQMALTTVSDGALDTIGLDDLDDLCESLADDSTVYNAQVFLAYSDVQLSANKAPALTCWGAVISGNTERCVPGFQPTGSHLLDKACAYCRSDGFYLPLACVRALHPEQHANFTNGHGAGLFSKVQPGLPAYRVINHTRDCSGPWLVLFESPPPPELDSQSNWAPIPLGWIKDEQFVRLWPCNGTFVAKQPRKRKVAQIAAASALAVSQQQASTPSPASANSASLHLYAGLSSATDGSDSSAWLEDHQGSSATAYHLTDPSSAELKRNSDHSAHQRTSTSAFNDETMALQPHATAVPCQFKGHTVPLAHTHDSSDTKFQSTTGSWSPSPSCSLQSGESVLRNPASTHHEHDPRHYAALHLQLWLC